MAAFAVKICKEITPAGSGLYENCLAGAFNNLARETIGKKWNLKVDTVTPLSVCDAQDESIRPVCLGNMKWVVVSLLGANGSPTNTVAPNIVQKLGTLKRLFVDMSSAYARSVTWTLAYEEGRKSTAHPDLSFDPVIHECAFLPPELTADCVGGFAVGLAKHAMPLVQHESVFSFCAAAQNAIPESKSMDCLLQAITYLKGFYGPSRTASMCKELEFKFGLLCSDMH